MQATAVIETTWFSVRLILKTTLKVPWYLNRKSKKLSSLFKHICTNWEDIKTLVDEKGFKEKIFSKYVGRNISKSILPLYVTICIYTYFCPNGSKLM